MALVVIGWAVVQASQIKFVEPVKWGDDEEIFDEIEAEDRRLREECRQLLESDAYSRVNWQLSFTTHGEAGLLKFSATENHRTSMVWELFEFLAAQSKGTYGLAYVQDDEDEPNRCNFKVWRILDGKLTEHDDPHFSPMKRGHAFAAILGPKYIDE